MVGEETVVGLRGAALDGSMLRFVAVGSRDEWAPAEGLISSQLICSTAKMIAIGA